MAGTRGPGMAQGSRVECDTGQRHGGPRGMTLSPRDRANRAQLEASDPAVSAFVAASAGSGKTKLLTDRLLRLMLAGAKPDRIQCLTFTKAAAAEMALRLQRTLGRWVTLPADRLAADLARLEVEPTERTLAEARALFARVLDLPGGMRIGTIHAFCQSLLRRFPLEAALSPHFQLVDDRDAEDALTEAREDMLAAAHAPEMRAALERLAGLSSAEQFGRHVAALQSDRDRLDAALALGPALEAAQRRAAGVTAASDQEIVANAVNWQSERDLRAAATAVQQHGSPAVAQRSAAILGWLGLDATERAEHWSEWRKSFFTGGGEKRAGGAFVNPKLAAAHPEWLEPFLAEADRIEAVDDQSRALHLAAISAGLVTLAAPVLRAYASHKDASGLLDYDDLIGRTSALLVDPGAAWVLYKLDGGLDHLLLDEVQDTAPRQWQIAHALTEEFFAGSGARDTTRTVFAVGDRKQSIYSFQGADAEEFEASHELPEAPGGDRPACRGATPGSTCRSAPPRRCWNWWTRCSPTRSRAAGVVDAGRDPRTLRRSRRACRAGGAVAARAAAGLRAARALDRAGAEPGPELGAAAPGRHAGRLDPRADRRRRDAGEQGPPARARRRAGAGPPPQRVRPRAGAGAEDARRAGRRAGPPGADRTAGGAGPDGAVRCAAAAAGRPDLRLPADQPARRPDR